MTFRLLLLSAIALCATGLSACGGGGSHPVSLGITNGTSSLILTATYSLDGELLGVVENAYPESETMWVDATGPTPSPDSQYEIALEFSSGLIETIAVDAADGPAEWVHVGTTVSTLTAEASPGNDVTAQRAPRGDLAPSAPAPPSATDAATPDSVVTLAD